MVTNKSAFSRAEKIRFQEIMTIAILRLCPNIAKLHKLKADGKYRNICMLFILLFGFLQMEEKVSEVKQYYEHKLYKAIPILPLLLRYFIQLSKKMLSNQLKFLK
jgi:hypothetical protein